VLKPALQPLVLLEAVITGFQSFFDGGKVEIGKAVSLK
jgi:hypothetical protein